MSQTDGAVLHHDVALLHGFRHRSFPTVVSIGQVLHVQATLPRDVESDTLTQYTHLHTHTHTHTRTHTHTAFIKKPGPKKHEQRLGTCCEANKWNLAAHARSFSTSSSIWSSVWLHVVCCSWAVNLKNVNAFQPQSDYICEFRE